MSITFMLTLSFLSCTFVEMTETQRQNVAIKPGLYKEVRLKAAVLGKTIAETINIVLERGLKDMNRPRRKENWRGSK